MAEITEHRAAGAGAENPKFNGQNPKKVQASNFKPAKLPGWPLYDRWAVPVSNRWAKPLEAGGWESFLHLLSV